MHVLRLCLAPSIDWRGPRFSRRQTRIQNAFSELKESFGTPRVIGRSLVELKMTSDDLNIVLSNEVIFRMIDLMKPSIIQKYGGLNPPPTWLAVNTDFKVVCREIRAWWRLFRAVQGETIDKYNRKSRQEKKRLHDRIIRYTPQQRQETQGQTSQPTAHAPSKRVEIKYFTTTSSSAQEHYTIESTV
jgi:hypothetical protein